MKKNLKLSLCALTLAVTTAFSMGGSSVNAATGETGTDGLKMSKTAVLQPDGTYTINLEAYATGTVTTTTTTTVKPTDFILVLDQSGSMVQNNMNGIPTGYSAVATPSHAEVANGEYYVKVGEDYHRVNVSEKVTGSVVAWVGDDGKTYTDQEVTNTWTDHLGRRYTGNYFATSSLKTFRRQYNWGTFYYKNDNDDNEQTQRALNAKGARDSFLSTNDKNKGYSAEFHNDGAPGTSTAEDNKYYVAAKYIRVTKQTVNTKEYTYSYVDASGKNVTIGTYGENDKTTETLYQSSGTTTGTRLTALKYAANKFVSDIHNNAVANSVDHRIAVVGFASAKYGDINNEYYYSNTELFIGADQYNYQQGGKESTYNSGNNLAANKYASAFQSARTNAGYANLQASISTLAGKGGTHPELGFEMANGIMEANQDANRNKVIVFLTDGEPGDTEYSSTVANAAINKAATSKSTYSATVYSVGVLNQNEVTSDIQDFLNNVSSNGTHTIATDVTALQGFFETVTNTTTSTEASVELDENAYMLDVMGEDFQLRSDATVTCKVAKHAGDHAFYDPKEAPADVKAEIVGNTVKVTGFNYTAKENLVTTNVSSGGSTIANGNKLVVTITGVEAKDSAVTGGFVSTNDTASGIYSKSKTGEDAMVKAFEQPLFQLTEQSFVLDYAKKAELDVKNIGTAEKIDDATDLMLNKVTATEQIGRYGKAAVAGGKVSYETKTMNWDGYDSFYVLGNNTTKYDWAKINVLPATSVYYEDDFVTNEDAGTVGIEYLGEWTVDGTASGNTEEANNPVQGWIESLGDDVTYSDGAAHVSSTAGATATFTFTGTGVDVYSRTNMETGTVLVTLKETNSASTAVNKILVVDNKAKDGEYYQIPTVFFNNLNYGTYTVTIKVTNAAVNDEGRKTYYLDGIRVYNPLNPENTGDETINSAYAEQNTKVTAMFSSVRDLLIQDISATTVDGAVFIDENAAGTTENTSNLAVYEELGPKNEVYLAAGQSIVFQAYVSETPIYIGLKAPKGETKAAFTNADGAVEATITSPADLYYQIKPNTTDGMVTVKNTGSNLLSITKICVPEVMEAAGTYMATMNVEDAVSYANTFAALPCSEYKANAIAETEITNPDQNAGDVEIDNGTVDDNMTKPATPALNWVKNLFNALRKWFN